jgi:hypothetical protein
MSKKRETVITTNIGYVLSFDKLEVVINPVLGDSEAKDIVIS